MHTIVPPDASSKSCGFTLDAAMPFQASLACFRALMLIKKALSKRAFAYSATPSMVSKTDSISQYTWCDHQSVLCELTFRIVEQ